VELVETRLIAGLGNPDQKYQNTRHNFGFLVVEELARKAQVKFRKDASANALTAGFDHEDVKCVLQMPLTYMNLSGAAVEHIVKKKNIALEHTLIICDDLDLPFGQMRLRAHGSAGGHNGLKSIIEKLGTNEFARLRLGIGRPQGPSGAVGFVLDQFSAPEKKQLPHVISKAIECCQVWMSHGVNEAMSQFNQRKNDE
jgi:peptidyl-tRNA hydrolase, PTH1 family